MKGSSLKDVRVPVEVVLGGTELTVEDLTRVGEGTIIELTKLAGETVELKAAGKTIALGEVVVIDENFGIRVTSIISGND
jgi:flagellar motor switch protein FliN